MPKEIDIRCKHCGCNEIYNANDVYTKPIIGNTSTFLILLLFTIIVMIFLYSKMRLLVAGFAVPSLLYAIYINDELKKVNLFNSTKVNNKINTK